MGEFAEKGERKFDAGAKGTIGGIARVDLECVCRSVGRTFQILAGI
jgi:hypothetical protein